MTSLTAFLEEKVGIITQGYLETGLPLASAPFEIEIEVDDDDGELACITVDGGQVSVAGRGAKEPALTILLDSPAWENLSQLDIVGLAELTWSKEVLGKILTYFKGDLDPDATIEAIFENPCRLELLSETGGQTYLMVVGIGGGEEDDPTLTVRFDQRLLSDFLAKKLEPAAAYGSGRVKVEGARAFFLGVMTELFRASR